MSGASQAFTVTKIKHENVIRSLDFFEDNGTAYLVMEYHEGESLADHLKRKNTMTEDQILGIIVPVLRGVFELEKNSRVHLDIKPGNIYIPESQSPKLIDFGSAKKICKDGAFTQIVSDGYSPHEQYTNDGQDRKTWSDLYAVGAIMYQCIAGYKPVEAVTRYIAVVKNQPDPLRPARKIKKGQYSAEFLETIDWCLKPEIKDRPQSTKDVLDKLKPRSSNGPHECGVLTDFQRLLRPRLWSSIHASVSRSSSSSCSRV